MLRVKPAWTTTDISENNNEDGTNDELCEGGLMDICERGVTSDSYLSESCGRRFVEDEGSSTGYIQCVWKTVGEWRPLATVNTHTF